MGNTGYVKETEAQEITFDLYVKVIDEESRPLPGIDLLFYVGYANWPAYAFSGPPFGSTLHLVRTDEGGLASLHDKHGFSAGLRDGDQILRFYINGAWQIYDRENSEGGYSSWRIKNTSNRTLPIPRDDPAINRLREANREELLSISRALEHRRIKESELPNYYQLRLPDHLTEGKVPDGYAGDAW